MRQLRLTLFRPRTVVIAVAFGALIGVTGAGIVGVGVLQPNEQEEIPTGNGTIDSAEIEEDILKGINERRTDEGLNTLERREDIDAIARAHSQDMHERDFTGHTNPDGEGPGDRLAPIDDCQPGSENYAWMDVHEEVHPEDRAATYDTRSTDGMRYAFMDWWDHSEPHRENQLNPDWEYVGVGVVVKGGTGYATVNFC